MLCYRIADIPHCKMPLQNLAKVFGPTVIGYSCNEPESVFGETQIGNKVTYNFIFFLL